MILEINKIMYRGNNIIYNFLSDHISLLRTIGERYFNCAEKLFKENDPKNSLYPFCLLATTALELFLKVIIAVDICIKEKDIKNGGENVKTMIVKKLKDY
ncbi:MAG: hypothetical protein ACTSRA_23085, partial [Promethearchaeota archaeon]